MKAWGLIVDKLGLDGGIWIFVGEMNYNLANFGFAVVEIFLVSWIVSTIIYRANRYDTLHVG